MNTLDIRAELSIKMLELEKAIDMGLPYPELKKIYTEIKELQLQVAFTDAEKSTSKSSDLIIE
jgi:hypothetical protein